MNQQEFEFLQPEDEGSPSPFLYRDVYEGWQERPIDEFPIDAQYEYDSTFRSARDRVKLVPVRPRRFEPWNIVLLAALAIFMTGAMFGFTLSGLPQSSFSPAWHSHSIWHGGWHHRNHNYFPPMGSNVSQQTFPVSGSLNLSIDDLASGTIHIQTADTNSVVMSETGLNTDTNPVPGVSYQGHNLSLDVKDDEDTGDTGVTLDITVPLDTSLSIQSNSADINFSGLLDPDDLYQFTTQTGSIYVSLPADAAFNLGLIKDNGDFANDFDSDVNGNGPRATLNLFAQDGAVTIQKTE